MVTLYLIRHGQTELNKAGVFLGSRDEALNGLGMEQSKTIREVMKTKELDCIITSPLKRCYDTAACIASGRSLSINIAEEFKEMDFGLWEGMHHRDISLQYPKEWSIGVNNWKDMHPAKGESFRDFYTRVSEAGKELLKMQEGKKVALISHDGPMKVIASFLLNLGMDGFWNFHFEHGKYSLFEIEEGHCTIRKINSIE